MKLLPLLACAVALITPAFGNEDVAKLRSFRDGCKAALRIIRQPDAKVTAVEINKAADALGYVSGFFDSARSTQLNNPDVRLLDPGWVADDRKGQLSRSLEIAEGLLTLPDNDLKGVGEDRVLALAIRSKSGAQPDLNKPR